MDSVNAGKRIFAVILCVALLGIGGLPVRAQQSGQYFPASGHNVVGEFWSFYQGVPDASVVFGAPLTEAFASADGSGLTVQYFQYVRFELHPDQPVGSRVQLTPLGSRLYQPGNPAVNVTTPGACRTFATGFGVCYDFLAFYDAHGGAARFGNPVSAFEFLPDGRLVQSFEYARLEWHPELPAGQNVTLTELGRQGFNALGEDPLRLTAVQPLSPDIVNRPPVLTLHAMAFVWKAVTLTSDTQKVYVVVQDQALAPVEGASGSVTLHLTDGRSLTYPVVTDAHGVSTLPAVQFSGQIPGELVVVDLQIGYQGLSSRTTTSFRIWH